MPDLRELVKAVVDPGVKTPPSSSSGVAERGSENDVTPECLQAALESESDNKTEPGEEWWNPSSRAEADDIIGAVTR